MQTRQTLLLDLKTFAHRTFLLLLFAHLLFLPVLKLGSFPLGPSFITQLTTSLSFTASSSLPRQSASVVLSGALVGFGFFDYIFQMVVPCCLPD